MVIADQLLRQIATVLRVHQRTDLEAFPGTGNKVWYPYAWEQALLLMDACTSSGGPEIGEHAPAPETLPGGTEHDISVPGTTKHQTSLKY